MTQANGWPYPDKPGVPLNPERDGWHWLQNRKPGCAPCPVQWKADGGWVWNAIAYFPNPDTAFRYAYRGPCLTPAEVAAREQAAAVAMREACAAQVCAESDDLLALPLPTGALDRLLREAEARGMERAAALIDCGCAARQDVLRRLVEAGERQARAMCLHGDVCCALQAAEIRAAAKEVPTR